MAQDNFTFTSRMNNSDARAEADLANRLREIGKSDAVRQFLGKYGPVRTRRGYASQLTLYFRWLRNQEIELSPDELITENLRCVYKSDPTDVKRKKTHTDWLLRYVNEFMAAQKYTFGTRRLAAAVIRQFYARNDSVLFGDFAVAEDNGGELEEPLVPKDIRLVLKSLPLNVRLPFLLIWQSASEIDKVLRLRWKDVAGIDAGEYPLKLRFSGRKKQRRPYYTFLGRDGVEHLKLWRAKWTEAIGRQPGGDDFVLIGKGGKPVNYAWLEKALHKTVRRLASERMLQNNEAGSWHSHAFRKSFKTEGEHAGAKTGIIEFFMGHTDVLERYFSEFKGVATVDGWKPYRYFSIIQRCWGHILREAEALSLRARDKEEALRLLLSLRSIFHETKNELREHPPPNQELHDRMLRRLRYLLSKRYRDADVVRLVSKLKEASRDLFTFTLHPGVQPTNNHAERQLKEPIVHRKIRGQLKSEEGMTVFSRLMTAMSTWKLQGLNPFLEFRRYV